MRQATAAVTSAIRALLAGAVLGVLWAGFFGALYGAAYGSMRSSGLEIPLFNALGAFSVWGGLLGATGGIVFGVLGISLSRRGIVSGWLVAAALGIIGAWLPLCGPNLQASGILALLKIGGFFWWSVLIAECVGLTVAIGLRRGNSRLPLVAWAGRHSARAEVFYRLPLWVRGVGGAATATLLYVGARTLLHLPG